MSLFILCVVAAICMAADGVCPPGWTLFSDSCYDVVMENEDWAEANYICETRQGHMTVIESSAENDFVKTLMKTAGVTTDVWIGANDLFEEGVFRWTATHQKLTFEDWTPGEPNNMIHDENCLEIEKLAGYHWNDDLCTKKQPFICETSPSSHIVG